MRLRRHQSDVRNKVELVGEEIEERKSLVIQAAPGAGKSMLPVIAAAGLIPRVCDRICWVVPRRSLAVQAARAFLDRRFRGELRHSLEIREAVNEGDPCRDTQGYVTTYSALLEDHAGTHSREFRRHRYLLVLDEFHHLWRGGEYAAAVEPLEDKAAFILRMTGTAFRHDRSPIAGIEYSEDGFAVKDDWVEYSIGDAIHEKAIREVAFSYVDGATKWKDPTTGTTEEAEELGEERRRLFVALRTGYAVDLLERTLEDWLRFKSQHPWSKFLVVCAEKSQARKMLEYLRDRRSLVNSEIATSDDSKSALRAIESFRTGGLDILVTIQMCYEGLDVPEITHIACLTGIRSAPWIEQMIARAWRVVPFLPWEAQRARVYVPNDAAMREICEKIRLEIEDAIRMEDAGPGPGGGERSREQAEDEVIPLSSHATTALAGTLTNGLIDPELGARAQRAIDQTGIPVTADQLLTALEFMERDPARPEPGDLPDVTACERERALRDEVKRHTGRYCAVNGIPYKQLNEDILRAGFKPRGQMTESELLGLLDYVRKRWPL